MRNRFFYIILFSTCFLFSCAVKNDPSPQDGYAARITIHEPVEDDIVSAENYMLMKTTFEYEQKIQNTEIILLNLTSGDTIYYFNKDANADYVYFVNEEIFIAAEAGDLLELTASTWHKHPENKISETLYLSVD